jgi:lipoyl(octanoyl) transferase
MTASPARLDLGGQPPLTDVVAPALEFLYPGLGSEQIDYEAAWQLQRSVHAEVAAGDRPGTVILLEHSPVYTAGKRTEPHERPVDHTPVIDVDRGGKITWHGPGQLVGYPIVALPDAVYVVDYVRRLEEAMIRLFADFDLATGRVPGRSGVWLPADPPLPHPAHRRLGPPRPERKIAAIGVRVAGRTTMHGFAINVDPDLSAFDRIIPCGIADAGVTSMAAELDEQLTLTEVAHTLRPHLVELLSFEPYEKSADLEPAAAPPGGPTSRSPQVTVALRPGATTLV